MESRTLGGGSGGGDVTTYDQVLLCHPGWSGAPVSALPCPAVTGEPPHTSVFTYVLVT